MPYDPTLPINNSPISSAELRNQFAGLKALIDAQQAQITALQAALDNKAEAIVWSELDPGFSDPPTTPDLEAIRNYINNLVTDLTS